MGHYALSPQCKLTDPQSRCSELKTITQLTLDKIDPEPSFHCRFYIFGYVNTRSVFVFRRDFPFSAQPKGVGRTHHRLLLPILRVRTGFWLA